MAELSKSYQDSSQRGNTMPAWDLVSVRPANMVHTAEAPVLMQKSCRLLRIHSLSRYPRIWYSCESWCLHMWRCQAQPLVLQMDDHVLVFRMVQSTVILTQSWKVVQVSSSNFRCLRRALNIARCTLSRSSPSPGSQGHRDKRKTKIGVTNRVMFEAH